QVRCAGPHHRRQVRRATPQSPPDLVFTRSAGPRLHSARINTALPANTGTVATLPATLTLGRDGVQVPSLAMGASPRSTPLVLASAGAVSVKSVALVRGLPKSTLATTAWVKSLLFRMTTIAPSAATTACADSD